MLSSVHSMESESSLLSKAGHAMGKPLACLVSMKANDRINAHFCFLHAQERKVLLELFSSGQARMVQGSNGPRQSSRARASPPYRRPAIPVFQYIQLKQQSRIFDPCTFRKPTTCRQPADPRVPFQKRSAISLFFANANGRWTTKKTLAELTAVHLSPLHPLHRHRCRPRPSRGFSH